MKKISVLLLALFACPLARAASQPQSLPAEKAAERKAQERLEVIHAQNQANARRLLQKIDQERKQGVALPAPQPEPNNSTAQPFQSETPEQAYERIRSIAVREITPKDVGEEISKRAVALRMVSSVLLALGHGLLNNWLARRAGCGSSRWRFYQAPLREWITGAVVWAVRLSCVGKVLSGENRKPTCSERIAEAVMLFGIQGAYQELGEAMPILGYEEGWRSLSGGTLGWMQINTALQSWLGLILGIGVTVGYKSLVKA